MTKKDTNASSKITEGKQIQIPPVIGLESVIGAATILTMQSRSHEHLFASDFKWLIMPPIALKQFKLFRHPKQNAPLAFVSWASVTEETENRLLSGTVKLAPKDWNEGDRLWLIDVVSPFTSQKGILKQLADSEFKDKTINILRPGKDAKTFVGIELKTFLKESQKSGNDTANEASH